MADFVDKVRCWGEADLTVERRRRWSRDDKMRIIEETLAPGGVVTEIARRHGISTSLVFTWRVREQEWRISRY
jgi:transposase